MLPPTRCRAWVWGWPAFAAATSRRGRSDLDLAVALDPSSALLRTYLGKAYFEEFRDDLAEQQFSIAKELDPNDPTPYLYDAIMKQTQNRPVEALEQLDRSIALNENRAIHRSGIQLDEDRAARGTALARIYDDLGFRDLGLNQASQALSYDPSSTAAHRLLSDLYLGTRRLESARVSNLLQAQLLQNVNLNPVQPSLSETNLNIIGTGGPADVGFNEFTPLFTSNGVQLNASGLAGNEDTYGAEGVATVLHDWISVSGGAFHYSTDGWRSNNDIEHTIYNFFVQAAVTPQLNLQVELRDRDSNNGDLAFNFDQNAFSDNFKRKLDQDLQRIGVRYSPGGSSDFLLSAIHSHRDETIRTEEPIDPVTVVNDRSEVKDDAYQVEGQHIFRRDIYNITTGGAYSNVDRKIDVNLAFNGEPFVDDSSSDNIDHHRGYIYGNLELPTPVTWTLGLSVDRYEEADFQETKVNPKLGVQWRATDDVTVRAAAFRYVKPALPSNLTIEPTQVAGFDQLFDDINGTSVWRYGVGVDWRLRENLFGGAEATWRELSEPLFADGDARTENRSEQTHRLYLYWTPLPRWAVRTEFIYDRFRAQKGLATEFGDVPDRVQTLSLPIGVRYFDPSGLFAGLTASAVHQEVKRSPGAPGGEGTDDFVVVDGSVGYRFPRRIGAISLQVLNLFNSGFDFQDDSYREFRDEPTIGPYIPERQIRAQLTLNF